MRFDRVARIKSSQFVCQIWVTDQRIKGAEQQVRRVVTHRVEGQQNVVAFVTCRNDCRVDGIHRDRVQCFDCDVTSGIAGIGTGGQCCALGRCCSTPCHQVRRNDTTDCAACAFARDRTARRRCCSVSGRIHQTVERGADRNVIIGRQYRIAHCRGAFADQLVVDKHGAGRDAIRPFFLAGRDVQALRDELRSEALFPVVGVRIVDCSQIIDAVDRDIWINTGGLLHEIC